MSRPDTRSTIEALKTYTGQPWVFRDGKFQSAPLPESVADRMLTNDRMPASQSRSGKPGDTHVTLSLSVTNAETFIEDMQRERSSLGKGA